MNFSIKKSDLNFKVYTASSIPTAPGVENDIVIVTSVPMTNWIMSPEKPSGIPRNDGDVWIQYSTKGDTFNALKQNALMIATIRAWQYADGVWVDREAVSCQGGEWFDWCVLLYLNGDQNEAITGGWQNAYSSGTGGTISFDDSIVFSLNKGNSSYGAVMSASHKTPVDLSDYTEVSIDAVRISGGTIKARVEISESSTNRTFVAQTDEIVLSEEVTKIHLNISGINGKYYIHVVMSNGGLNSAATIGSITNVRLKKGR